MKYILILTMCLALVGTHNNAFADASSDASSNQSQGQGQQQVGGIGSGSASSNQGQGQTQYSSGGGGGSGGSVSNAGNSTVGFNNSFNGAAPIRYLPIPSAVPMENYQPGMFGRADYEDKGPNFISMRQIVAALNLADLNTDVEGKRHIRILSQKLGIVKAKPIGKTPKDKSKITQKPIKVKFEINDGETVNHGFKPIAVLSVETEKPDKSNSASLALAIGKKAHELGATRVVFLTEGSSKELHSSGWGIGFSYNYATVGSKASDNGSVGSGGTGYSQGKAGYSNLIYLTAIVGN